jgi:hypothetical protein
LEDGITIFLLHDERLSLFVKTNVAAQFRKRLRSHLP